MPKSSFFIKIDVISIDGIDSQVGQVLIPTNKIDSIKFYSCPIPASIGTRDFAIIKVNVGGQITSYEVSNSPSNLDCQIESECEPCGDCDVCAVIDPISNCQVIFNGCIVVSVI